MFFRKRGEKRLKKLENSLWEAICREAARREKDVKALGRDLGGRIDELQDRMDRLELRLSDLEDKLGREIGKSSRLEKRLELLTGQVKRLEERQELGELPEETRRVMEQMKNFQEGLSAIMSYDGGGKG